MTWGNTASQLFNVGLIEARILIQVMGKIFPFYLKSKPSSWSCC